MRRGSTGHAIRRLWERYGLIVTSSFVNGLSEAIAGSKSRVFVQEVNGSRVTFIRAKDSTSNTGKEKGGSVWLVSWDGNEVPLVVSSGGYVVTAYPPVVLKTLKSELLFMAKRGRN